MNQHYKIHGRILSSNARDHAPIPRNQSLSHKIRKREVVLSHSLSTTCSSPSTTTINPLVTGPKPSLLPASPLYLNLISYCQSGSPPATTYQPIHYYSLLIQSPEQSTKPPPSSVHILASGTCLTMMYNVISNTRVSSVPTIPACVRLRSLAARKIA